MSSNIINEGLSLLSPTSASFRAESTKELIPGDSFAAPIPSGVLEACLLGVHLDGLHYNG